MGPFVFKVWWFELAVPSFVPFSWCKFIKVKMFSPTKGGQIKKFKERSQYLIPESWNLQKSKLANMHIPIPTKTKKSPLLTDQYPRTPWVWCAAHSQFGMNRNFSGGTARAAFKEDGSSGSGHSGASEKQINQEFNLYVSTYVLLQAKFTKDKHYHCHSNSQKLQQLVNWWDIAIESCKIKRNRQAGNIEK